MIIGFIGKRGSGKSISLTRELFKYSQKGVPIYSNYHLNFPHRLVDFEELYNMANSGENFENMVLALDEVHIFLDSRSSMSKENKVFTYWLNLTRKLNVHVFYTTQFLHQVDRRLRSNTDVFVFCDGLTVTRTDADGVEREYFVCQNEMVFGEEFKREIFIANPFFPLYETRQVIRFLSRKAKLDADYDGGEA